MTLFQSTKIIFNHKIYHLFTSWNTRNHIPPYKAPASLDFTFSELLRFNYYRQACHIKSHSILKHTFLVKFQSVIHTETLISFRCLLPRGFCKENLVDSFSSAAITHFLGKRVTEPLLYMVQPPWLMMFVLDRLHSCLLLVLVDR